MGFEPKDRDLTGTDAERLVALEIASAEQERVIAELSEQIAAQWRTIDRLQRGLEVLGERFLSIEERTAPDVPVTRPPHW